MKRKPRAIVSVTNDLLTDNRVNKISLFLVEQGYDVLLIGRVKKDSLPLTERVYRTRRMRLLFEKGPVFYAEFNFRLFLALSFRRTDLLVSNDLDTLLANYLAKLFKVRTKLVYDSHEFFTEVPELVNRPKIQKIWEKIEKRLFPKVDAVYTVNDSIARLYEEKYKRKVFVVRNISPKWQPIKHLTRADLGLPEDKFILILQGAGINIHRGSEEAVEAMKYLKNTLLLIVGDGDVIPQLKNYVKSNHLEEKVLFFGKRPYDEMMQFTYNSDLGLTLDKANNMNYQFSLPNKVFDYLHAYTPILCTNLPEVAAVVNRNSIGKVLDDFSVESLVREIEFLQTNPNILEEMKENCKIASEVESWEHEKEVLKIIYSNYGT